MKTHLILLIWIIVVLDFNSFAQYCNSANRFTQTPVFSISDIQKDSMVYANAIDWQGVNQSLKLDVFYPNNSVDTISKRPMVLMIFGGGFVNGDRGQVAGYCMNLARRGFVAVGIDYRLGKETVLPCSDTLSQEKAVYRAIQDAHAAIRFMVAHAASYKIDTAWIFAGGFSAGASTANALVYNSQAETNLIYPGIVAELGNLNNSGNNLTTTFAIKGIFNNWGGVSSDFFDSDEAVPTISFHGSNDGVVPIDSALDVTCFTTNHYIFGSHALYEKLTAVGICSDLTVKMGAGHGVYQGGEGLLMRVNRASCFFKSLFCNTCSDYASTDSLTPNCAEQPLRVNNLPDQEISIYPNPANDEIQIETGTAFPLKIQLLNALGIPVLTAENQKLISVKHLPEGIYFVLLYQENKIYTRKIVKLDRGNSNE